MNKIGVLIPKVDIAFPIISQLRLEAVIEGTIYQNDKGSIVLIISGTGKISSSLATSLLHYKYEVNYILHIGTCVSYSSRIDTGDLLLIERVYEYEEGLRLLGGKGYYDSLYSPILKYTDILIGEVCVTVSTHMNQIIDTDLGEYVVDREYYSIAQSASYYGLEYTGIKIALPPNVEISTRTIVYSLLKLSRYLKENLLV